MTKTFDIPFSGDAATLLKHAKDAAVEAGAILTGDTNEGKFSGKGVEGHYKVDGNTMHVTITKKPIVVTDSFVESQIRKFFANH
jgi:hypothetical protein